MEIDPRAHDKIAILFDIIKDQNDLITQLYDSLKNNSSNPIGNATKKYIEEKAVYIQKNIKEMNKAG